MKKSVAELEKIVNKKFGEGLLGYFYALCDPKTKAIRYIGYTKNPVQRLKQHIKYCKGTSHRSRWISKLLSQGLVPHMEIFFLNKKEFKSWEEAERTIINICRSEGFRLTNTSDGGMGGSGGPGPTRPDHIEKLRQAQIRNWEDPTYRERHIKSLTGRRLSPESIAKRSETVRGSKRSPKTRKRISEGIKRAHRENPEIGRKISASRKGIKFSKEHRAKLSEAKKRAKEKSLA